jgi:hypothetical protein
MLDESEAHRGAQMNEYNVIKLTPERITWVPSCWTEKQWKPDGKSLLNAGWRKVASRATPTPAPK